MKVTGKQSLLLLLFVFLVSFTFLVKAETPRNPRLFWGFYTANSYEATFHDEVYALKQKIGRHPTIVHWFMNFGEDLAIDLIKEVRRNGSFPLVTWQPFYGDGTLKQILSGSKDSVINKFINQVISLKRSFFLRPAHEMNGNWYPWSEQYAGNAVGDYAKFWRKIWNMFEAKGANKDVTWVWNPNVGTYPGVGYDDIQGLYPGNKFVDWAGINCFNFGNPYLNMSVFFGPTYNALQKFTSTKKIIIGEIATGEDGNKKGWIYDALHVQLVRNFPKVKAFVWFDENQPDHDWRIDSSPASLNMFKDVIDNGHYTIKVSTTRLGKIQPPSNV
jgi:hypothetical protein